MQVAPLVMDDSLPEFHEPLVSGAYIRVPKNGQVISLKLGTISILVYVLSESASYQLSFLKKLLSNLLVS